MSGKRVWRVVSILLGVILLIGGVCAVILVRTRPAEEPLTRAVRPLKTVVVGGELTSSGRQFPGKVRANQLVDLAFQVAGPLTQLPVTEGQKVEREQLLASLDPRDFQNTLDARQAVLKQRELDESKIKYALERGAATQKEYDDAVAALRVAQADVKIAAKALEDTYMRAPFKGVVARRYVENFQNVQAKQPVLSLQDISHVDIVLNLPEEFVAAARATGLYLASARFEYLPGRVFDVTAKEFATEADPATQTYRVTLTMPAPTDVNILPGMTATVTITPKAGSTSRPEGYLLPIAALAIDGVGQYYVWRLQPAGADEYTAHRVNVTVGRMMGDSILVLEGVGQGELLAGAGVTLLNEGQRVRRLAPAATAPTTRGGRP